MVKAQVFILQKRFEGFPKETDVELVEEELPPLKDGEFMAKAMFLSVDPYMRAYVHKRTLGATMNGSQLARVVESKNPKFPVGTHVVGEFGWRTHTISTTEHMVNAFPRNWTIPDPEDLPLSLFLGVLGRSGATAYFGFLEICQPKPGETVVVTGAGGGIGSIVGQIAKIKGCTVIGVAGSEEKGKWLVHELGYDHFVNYKDENFVEKLKMAAPQGIDCYFDNVGGEISTQIINQMNLYGRISVCGAMSGYNDEETAKATPVQFALFNRELKMEGFIVYRWTDRWFECINQHKEWIKEGKLKYRETVTEGFENMFKAFVNMLQGGNIGKAIVKV